MEDSVVDGGVVILHQLKEGKHQYEVKSVFKHLRKKGEKHFFRRGDRLHLVNETELEDVAPEELANILSEGNPKLTVHKTVRKKEPVDTKPLGDDVMVPFSKKHMTLRFSQEMIRVDDPGPDDPLPPGPDEEGVCTEDDAQNDFLVVSMKKTSISVITGRSCDSKDPCRECEATCDYSDIVMVTESSTITLVPRGGGNFRLQKTSEAHVEHSHSSKYIQGLCSQNSVYVSDYPENITIYYYKSDGRTEPRGRGMPVVLNFTGSDCFLKCCLDSEQRAQLQVEMCEKQKLKHILKSDRHAMAYMFYMKSDPTKNTTFESALHSGWFMQVSNSDCVQMVQTQDYFHIIIKTLQSLRQAQQ